MILEMIWPVPTWNSSPILVGLRKEGNGKIRYTRAHAHERSQAHAILPPSLSRAPKLVRVFSMHFLCVCSLPNSQPKTQPKMQRNRGLQRSVKRTEQFRVSEESGIAWLGRGIPHRSCPRILLWRVGVLSCMAASCCARYNAIC